MKHLVPAVAAIVIMAACAQPTSNPTTSESTTPATSKSITIGTLGAIYNVGLRGGTSAGGFLTLNELHSDGLVTSDVNSRRPIGRLAERVPAIDDGSLLVLPDGRMRATYRLRSGVTWQDGVTFTADDLVFTYQVLSDAGLPGGTSIRAVRELDAVEALDARTVVFTFKGPFYEASIMSLKNFWPQPRHLLEEAFQKYQQNRSADEFLNHPYNSTDYVHLGPYRLASLQPQDVTFEAHAGYFLGKPKIDTIHVRPFNDQNTLFASVLAGSIDIVTSQSLSSDLAEQLRARWEASGEGRVSTAPGYLRMMESQWNRDLQREPANLDPRVRGALLLLIDREEMAEQLLAGHRELAAYSLLPTTAPNHAATKDGLLVYKFDPQRAATVLQEAGWSRGPDGILRNAADSRPYRTAVWALPGQEAEGAAIANYWRRGGLDIEENNLTGVQSRDPEYRAAFPGWGVTANAGERAIIAKIETASGGRGGYSDPRGQPLVDAFVRAVVPNEQLDTMRAINDFIVAELPILPLYHQLDYMGARKGVEAFADVAGGAGSGETYGTYSRNAYLWDVR